MTDDELTRNIKVAAQVSLAGGFILSAWAIFRDGRSGNLKGLGSGSLSKLPVHQLPHVKLPTSVEQAKKMGRPSLKQYDVNDIDQRAGLIGELIRKGSLNPDLREAVVKMLAMKEGGRWKVPEKDCLAEVKALFTAVRDPKSEYAVRYTRDAMLADVFTAAERTLLKTHGGDCDDSVVTLGAMLMSVGHPVRMRIVATRVPGKDDKTAPWSHIYLLTPTTFDNPNAKWISVDASMDKPLGWEAPGAAEVARTGKPAGIIARVRDYTLLKPAEQG